MYYKRQDKKCALRLLGAFKFPIVHSPGVLKACHISLSFTFDFQFTLGAGESASDAFSDLNTHSEILEPNASVLGKLLIYWALRSNPAGTNEEKNVRFSLI